MQIVQGGKLFEVTMLRRNLWENFHGCVAHAIPY